MSRFATVSEEEVSIICADKDAANTKKQTEILFNVLCAYCKEKIIDLESETISKEAFNNIPIIKILCRS